MQVTVMSPEFLRVNTLLVDGISVSFLPLMDGL
jgi:hypothetical protein